MCLYFNTPYCKCNGNEATLYTRSGDFAIGRIDQSDGATYNDIAISRSEYKFQRENNVRTRRKDRKQNANWKLKSGNIAARIFHAITVDASGDDVST